MSNPDASTDKGARASRLLPRLGRRLRELRKATTLTQEQLADAIGIGSDGISQIERGVNFTSVVHAEMIAETLGVPLHELFRVDPGEEFPPEVKRLIELLADQPPEIRRAIVAQAELTVGLARQLRS